MSETHKKIEQYLANVKEELKLLPDRNEIVSELKTHIWDMANKFATKKNMNIDNAFEMALEQMEDPKSLADQFYKEAGIDNKNGSISSNYNKLVYPESKIENEQFLIISIIGIIGIVLGTYFIAQITEDPLITFFGSIIQIFAIMGFILILYYRDDQHFRAEIQKLRKKFEKQTKIALNRHNRDLKSFFDKPEFSAVGTHISGAFSLVTLGVFAVILAFLHITNAYPLFNDVWFAQAYVVAFAYIGIKMIQALIKAFVGTIRFTRISDSIFLSVESLGLLYFIQNWPFTIGEFMIFFTKEFINDQKIINFLQYDLDSFIIILFVIIIVINMIKIVYNIFKFYSWNPSEDRSLFKI